MREHGRVVPIISKIEKPEAVDYLEHIIDVSDGIMIARGDLGVELPPEQVPRVQRRGIRMARERGKLTVVATQMLMSMTTHARPTHAEVSDVANAVFDGADAVMLSEETAAGQFPVRAVETMSALAGSAEEASEAFRAPQFVDSIRASHAWAICRAAVVTADEDRCGRFGELHPPRARAPPGRQLAPPLPGDRRRENRWRKFGEWAFTGGFGR